MQTVNEQTIKSTFEDIKNCYSPRGFKFKLRKRKMSRGYQFYITVITPLLETHYSAPAIREYIKRYFDQATLTHVKDRGYRLLFKLFENTVYLDNDEQSHNHQDKNTTTSQSSHNHPTLDQFENIICLADERISRFLNDFNHLDIVFITTSTTHRSDDKGIQNMWQYKIKTPHATLDEEQVCKYFSNAFQTFVGRPDTYDEFIVTDITTFVSDIKASNIKASNIIRTDLAIEAIRDKLESMFDEINTYKDQIAGDYLGVKDKIKKLNTLYQQCEELAALISNCTEDNDYSNNIKKDRKQFFNTYFVNALVDLDTR